MATTADFKLRYETGDEEHLKAPIEITYEEFEVLSDIAETYKRDEDDSIDLTTRQVEILVGLADRELLN